jgi:hypothetical protein
MKTIGCYVIILFFIYIHLFAPLIDGGRNSGSRNNGGRNGGGRNSGIAKYELPS